MSWFRSLTVVLSLVWFCPAIAEDASSSKSAYQAIPAYDGSAYQIPQLLEKQIPSGAQTLAALQKQVKSVMQDCLKATVSVQVDGAQGSGVIVTEDGYVLTAAHVVGRPRRSVVLILSDGKRVDALVKSLDRNRDAAVLKICDPGPWPFAKVATSDTLPENAWLIAFGHPNGLISGRPAVLRVGRLLVKGEDVLRSDASLVGGDSGGPLFDLMGRVVGIHSFLGVTANFNFHVKSEAYLNQWDRMTKYGEWGTRIGDFLPNDNPRAYLGIQYEERTGQIRIKSIRPGFPGEDAGLQPGDIIKSIDGKPMSDSKKFVSEIRDHLPGDVIALTVQRNQDVLDLNVELVEAP